MSGKPAITGGIGHVPPAHAPKETSQPLTTEEVERQMALARAHEKPQVTFSPPADQQIRLPPGVSSGDPDAVAQFQAWTRANAPADWDAASFRAGGSGVAVKIEGSGAKTPKSADLRPDPAAIAVLDGAFRALDGERAVAAPVADAPKSHQPAASDSESPSRGVPKGTTDPGKAITGGFGVSTAGISREYIPMDGSEVCLLAQALLVDLAEQIARDLRFSLAVTYPRVRVRAELIVESYVADADFRVTRVAADPEGRLTPEEIARLHADEVVFVVVNQRQEVAADGRADSPANALRGELGLEIPHKQLVETPTGSVVVDRRG